MALTLYFAEKTRSTRPRWLLEELAVPYELRKLDLKKGEHKAAAYVAIHPHGVVPALTDGDVVVFESAAICAYLADKFPEKGLGPRDTPAEKAAYYQWLVYSMATLEPNLIAHMTAQRAEGAARDEEAVKDALEDWTTSCAVLSRALEGRPFLLGDRFTAVDVPVGAILWWAGTMKFLEGRPVLQAYVDRLKARPAFGKAREA